MVYVLYAVDGFSWVYQFKFKPDGTLSPLDNPSLVPCKIGLKIYSLNEQQVIIQNIMGLTVFNVVEKRVDFKFKFVDKYNFDISLSKGVVSLPRKQNGIIIDFGLDLDELDKYKSVNGEEKFVFENLNDIRLMFNKVYSKHHLSYLLIDESVVDWGS